MELYTIKLEDDKEYYIIDTIVNDNNKYLILANDETDDFTIRKVINVAISTWIYTPELI